MSRAIRIPFEHELRGYDSLHLAAALLGQEALAAPVTLVAYDHVLWLAAQAAKLEAWLEGLEEWAVLRAIETCQ